MREISDKRPIRVVTNRVDICYSLRFPILKVCDPWNL